MEKVNKDIDDMSGVNNANSNNVTNYCQPSTSDTLATNAGHNTTQVKMMTSTTSFNPSDSKERALENLQSSYKKPRPQQFFKDSVDNSHALWVPKIVVKHNYLTPFQLQIIFDKTGVAIGYEHPYKPELEVYIPPARFTKRVPELQPVPRPLEQTKLTYVDTEEVLDTLIQHLKEVDELAVDLEHHSLRSYQGFTCLIQMTTDSGGDFIIDALAMREHIHKLNVIFSDPNKIKVLHGADTDVIWLQRDFGVYIVGLFDTQQAAKILSLPKNSLQYLLKTYCNVYTDKKYQTADWRIRPLDADMMKYARIDTHYLLYIWWALKNELTKDGSDKLLHLVFHKSRQLCLNTYRKTVLHDKSHMEMYYRARKSFKTTQLMAPKQLYYWRDEKARLLDESVIYEHPYKPELKVYIPPARFIKRVPEPQPVPLPLEQTKLTYVDTEEVLDTLIQHLKEVDELAVDLEHHSFRTYQGFTCLIRMTTDSGGDFIIDALAMREHIHKLNVIFSDPNKTKVLHGADRDVAWLQRDFGVYIVGLFDTCQAAKILSLPKVSLQYLLNTYCNVYTDVKYQAADWRIRPIDADMMKHARICTHYLLYIWRALKNELTKDGSDKLLHLVFHKSRELCLNTYRKTVLHDKSHMKMYYCVRKSFNTTQLMALKQLYHWRDEKARLLDESVMYVLPNHSLLSLAVNLPREYEGIYACCSPLTPVFKKYIHEVLYIISNLEETKSAKNKKEEAAKEHSVQFRAIATKEKDNGVNLAEKTEKKNEPSSSIDDVKTQNNNEDEKVTDVRPNSQRKRKIEQKHIKPESRSDNEKKNPYKDTSYEEFFTKETNAPNSFKKYKK